jgi:hypothetical protein
MANRDEISRHGSKNGSKELIGTEKDQQGVLKDQKGPGQQNPKIGSQGPHGGGEGLTGMQPGAGHPRGR